jgi:hypothetical protein
MIRSLRIFRHYVPALTLALFLGDAAWLTAAALASVRLAGAAGADPTLRLPAAVAAVLLGLLALVMAGVYDLGLRSRTAELLARVLAAAALWAILAGAVAFALPALRPGRLAWLTAILLGASGVLVMRGLLWLLPSAPQIGRAHV